MAVRALLWSFGGSVQNEAGEVVINSKQTVDALKFMRSLYQETETAEVFTWDPSSNNRGMLAGKLSFTLNAISVTRTAEKDNPEMSKQIQLTKALAGPVRRIASEHVMDCYVIWKFAENVDGAKQFLADYIDSFADAFKASEFYNFPCFPKTVPNLKELIANDPKAVPDGQVQGARRGARLGDQRRLPGLRHRRHRRGVQHLRGADDVRQGGARRDDGGGRGGGRRGRGQAHLRQVEVGARLRRR